MIGALFFWLFSENFPSASASHSSRFPIALAWLDRSQVFGIVRSTETQETSEPIPFHSGLPIPFSSVPKKPNQPLLGGFEAPAGKKQPDSSAWHALCFRNENRFRGFILVSPIRNLSCTSSRVRFLLSP